MRTRMVLFFIAIIILAILQQVAIEYSLYWTYLWFDMPMHFYGGFCAALGFAILPFFHINLPKRYTGIMGYLAFVLFVGVVWEIYELVFGLSVVDGVEALIPDTTVDIILDLIGGYVGYRLVRVIPAVYDNN